MIENPGIYNDISIEDYHSDKSWISSTGLKHAKKSLSDYRLFLDGYYDGVEKPEFDFGNACELFLTNLPEFYSKVAIAPEHEWIADALEENPELKVPRSSKTFKEYQKQFIDENNGKYIIPAEGDQSFQTLEVIKARCDSDPYISALLTQITNQTSLYWVDPFTQLQMKTRPDLVHISKGVVINIKTTTDGSPEAFSRDLAKLNYPVQACCEIQGCLHSGLMEVEKYFWMVIEKTAPFNVQLYEFDMGDYIIVLDEYNNLLRKIKWASDNNVWPGYGIAADNKYGILTAKIPSWYKTFDNF